MWTPGIYCLSKFPIANTVLLTIVIRLYIRSIDLLTLNNLNFLRFEEHFSISPTSLPGLPLFDSLLLCICLVLDSAYKLNHTFLVCIWIISLSIISSRFIHIAANGRISFFKTGMYILQFLYPFIHQWTLRLFPYLGYCE